jgi:prepilin-type N-terminal cleavage/methylation domain-containing protein
MLPYKSYMVKNDAFSLIEILIAVAVIAIISAFLISSISGTTQQANQTVARQQQAELQTALGNWISAASAGPGGLAAARGLYNAQADKLSLLSNYLQADPFARLTASGSQVNSAALAGSRAALQFSPTWEAGQTPIVTWSNTAP